MRAMSDSLQQLAADLKAFAAARQWQPFHSPKNLASALAVEAAELLEPFQWLTEDQSRALPPERLAAVGGEVADVLIYLVQLSTALGLDPVVEARKKMDVNARRFPAGDAGAQRLDEKR